MKTKRNHYIPRYYLKGFIEPPLRQLWVYPKGQSTCFASCDGFDNVGCENHFYSQELEDQLFRLEEAAKPALARVRHRAPIGIEDKQRLSEYLAVLMKRVPGNRERVKVLAPTAIEDTRVEVEALYDRLARSGRLSVDEVGRRRREALEYLESFRTPPDWLYWKLTNADLAPQLADMRWHFYAFEDPEVLTCDDPVFFHKCYGIDNPLQPHRSEVSVPLSCHVVLWACRRPNVRDLCYVKGPTQMLREFNRRTVSRATRYVYSAVKAPWVRVLADKRVRLSRMEPD